MSKKFGIPANMSFDDFKRSPHWEAAMEEARLEAEHTKQKKAEAEAKRKEKGWKKPGTKPGTKPKDKKDLVDYCKIITTIFRKLELALFHLLLTCVSILICL